MNAKVVQIQELNDPVLLSEIIGALSYALDLTEGQPPGHCLRACYIGSKIGQTVGFTQDQLWELYYTLLLKDAGCSSNAARLFELYGSDERTAKYNFKFVNTEKLTQLTLYVIRHAGVGSELGDRLKRIVRLAREGGDLATELIQTRCSRGAQIARRLGFNEAVANGIHCLDEHYNGCGRPEGLKEKQIPVYAQIALLAQVADVFHSIGGAQVASDEVNIRNKTWFNPELVKAFNHLIKDRDFWVPLISEEIQNIVSQLEPKTKTIYINEDELDKISIAFADVIDSKSPFTFGHSTRVQKYTDGIAKTMGFSDGKRRWLGRGALLHDIGKLGISNSILDKPGKLTEAEFAKVKEHPRLTEEILRRMKPFKQIAPIAGAHHERLDGKGYHKGIGAEDIHLETRMMTVADIYDALTAKRPYRDAMPVEEALKILNGMRETAVDGECLEALIKNIPG